MAAILCATNACGEAKPSTDRCSVTCLKPEVEVVKTVSPAGPVDQGTLFHYTIVVSNPSKTVALQNVKVTDETCSETTYQGNVNPTPTSAPADTHTSGCATGRSCPRG